MSLVAKDKQLIGCSVLHFKEGRGEFKAWGNLTSHSRATGPVLRPGVRPGSGMCVEPCRLGAPVERWKGGSPRFELGVFLPTGERDSQFLTLRTYVRWLFWAQPPSRRTPLEENCRHPRHSRTFNQRPRGHLRVLRGSKSEDQ